MHRFILAYVSAEHRLQRRWSQPILIIQIHHRSLLYAGVALLVSLTPLLQDTQIRMNTLPFAAKCPQPHPSKRIELCHTHDGVRVVVDGVGHLGALVAVDEDVRLLEVGICASKRRRS